MHSARADETIDTDALHVADVRIDGLTYPAVIDTPEPTISWVLQSARRGARQSAYRIRVRSIDGGGSTCDLWDSGIVASADTQHIAWGGAPLVARQRAMIEIQCWDERGIPGRWSAPAPVEMGLLAPEDWTADWIGPAWDDPKDQPARVPYLRREFDLPSVPVKHARVYITSLGLYELHLNGRRVGDALFTPGYTSYSKRVQYQVYDVAAYLQPGENCIGAILADGWYRWVPASRGGLRNNGKPLALFVQLEIEYEGGERRVVASDGVWTCGTGALLSSELYHGERVDARRHDDRWCAPGYEASDWSPVRVLPPSPARLVATRTQPVREIEEILPTQITRRPNGEWLVDFGQNLVGWVRVSLGGQPGHIVTVRHGEALDQGGDLYTANLRTAEQTNVYTLAEETPRWFAPRFSFQGFRYAAIVGVDTLSPENVRGVVVHSDMPVAGSFSTDDPDLDALWTAIRWTVRSNFLDVPSDCPQRDERLAWGLDSPSILPTAATMFDVTAIYDKWLDDYAADQEPGGAGPVTAPREHFWWMRTCDLQHLLGIGPASPPDQREQQLVGVPGWSDSVAAITWALYERGGHSRTLTRLQPTIERWIDWVETECDSSGVWHPRFSFGDWLDAGTIGGGRHAGSSDPALFALAYQCRTRRIARDIARTLGDTAAAERHGERITALTAAFAERHLSSDGKVGHDAQADYVLALMAELVTPEERPALGRRLADLIARTGHLTTGIAATAHLLDVLTATGQRATALQLLRNRALPSWLYMLDQGATTIWERWDAVRPDGSFADPYANSMNHFALGSIGAWMMRELGGIDAKRDGTVAVTPGRAPDLGQVTSTLMTSRGTYSCCWTRQDTRLSVALTVPANGSADLKLSCDRAQALAIVQSEGTGGTITLVDSNADGVWLRVASGSYELEIDQSPASCG